METQFLRDGVYRSSLNARVDSRTVYRYKSPSLVASLDADKGNYVHQGAATTVHQGATTTVHQGATTTTSGQAPVIGHHGDGYYNRHFRVGDYEQRETPRNNDLENAYENLRQTARNPNSKSAPRKQAPKDANIASPPKPPRGRVNNNNGETLQKSPAKSNLYRSNSNLDLDRITNEHVGVPTNLGREYGSTSSLDLLADANMNVRDKQSFFSIVRNYKSKNADQRSPAPPKIQQLLRGNIQLPTGNKNNRPTTIPIPSPVNPVAPDLDSGEASPQTKPKSKSKSSRRQSGQEGPSLLQKLRGIKAESNEIKCAPNTNSEERIRRKVFVHYDSQSLSFRLVDATFNKNLLPKRRNTVTGASAASMIADEQADECDNNSDNGDDRCNEILLSCPFFRNEISMNDGLEAKFTSSMHHIHRFVVEGRRCYKTCRQSICNAVSVLDPSANAQGVAGTQLKRHKAFVVEHADLGATYYRTFFLPYEHNNYFGIDDLYGPMAVSIRRETQTEKNGNKTDYRYQYRLIVRTCELITLRGCIAEESIPSPSRISASRGIPPKDILDFLCPELTLSCMRLGDKKLNDQLLRLDEMGIAKSYKVGVLLCREGQSSEEELYNNESTTPAFDEFLALLGRKVRLKGFEGFRGGLDTKTDSTGTYSLHTTFLDYEMMFHVSTMLPFTPDDRQQLMRKCHVGNDIVTVVFQEPGSLPFSPRTVRSHFQHVFIVVRVNHPCSDRTTYSVAVSRSRDVPVFGPPLPDDAVFPKSLEFSDFLLMKIVNAENAVHKSERFATMSVRTRQEYLRHLAEESVNGLALDHQKSGKFQSGSGRKKDRNKSKSTMDVAVRGATSWQVQVEEPGIGQYLDAILAISETTVLLIDEDKKACVFAIPCGSVIGWTSLPNSLRLYYNHGECIVIRASSGDDDVMEIIARLGVVSQGTKTVDILLQRNSAGQLGFHVQAEGIVSEVDQNGPAWMLNLRTNYRIVEVGKFKTASLSLDQLIDILRAAQQIRVVVVPALEDGSLRKGCDECRIAFTTQPHYFLPTPADCQQDVEAKSVASYNHSEHSYGSERSGPSSSSSRRHDRSHDSCDDHNKPRTGDYYDRVSAENRLLDIKSQGLAGFSNRPGEKVEHYVDYNQRKPHSAIEKKSPRDNYLDVNTAAEISFDTLHETGSSNDLADILDGKQGMAAKDRRPFIPASPRVIRHGADTRSQVRPTEALRERSFQEELMRLISPDVPERLITADRAKSEENIHLKQSFDSSSSETSERIRLTREQRLSPRATSVFKSSQGSVWRKPNEATSVPLLENPSTIDWSNLVDTAKRLVEPGESSDSTLCEKAGQRPDKLSVRAHTSAPAAIPWRTPHKHADLKQVDLENRCQQLEAFLDEERRERLLLQVQNDELKRENERLQEESQAAAAQLRRFTQWFFSTMDRQ